MRNARRQRFLSHLQEDTLEEVFTRLKTKLDVLQQVIDIFKNDSDPTVQREIQTTKQEILRDIKALSARGINMMDVYAKFGGILYKAEIIKGQDVLEGLRKKQKDTQVVDFINEDMQLYKRNEINQQQFTQRYVDKYNQRIRPQLYIDNPRAPPQPRLQSESMSEIVPQSSITPRQQSSITPRQQRDDDDDLESFLSAMTDQLIGQRFRKMSSPTPRQQQQQRRQPPQMISEESKVDSGERMAEIIMQEQRQQQQSLQQSLLLRNQRRQAAKQTTQTIPESPLPVPILQNYATTVRNPDSRRQSKFDPEGRQNTPQVKPLQLEETDMSQISQQPIQQEIQFNLSPERSQKSPQFKHTPSPQKNLDNEMLIMQIKDLKDQIQDARNLDSDSLDKYLQMIDIGKGLVEDGYIEEQDIFTYIQEVLNYIVSVNGNLLDRAQIEDLIKESNSVVQQIQEGIFSSTERLQLLKQLLSELYQQMGQQPPVVNVDYDQMVQGINQHLRDIIGEYSAFENNIMVSYLGSINYSYHNGQLLLSGIYDPIPQQDINELAIKLQEVSNAQQDPNMRALIEQANSRFISVLQNTLDEYNALQQQPKPDQTMVEEEKKEVRRGRGSANQQGTRPRSKTPNRNLTKDEKKHMKQVDENTEKSIQNQLLSGDLQNGLNNLIVGLQNYISSKKASDRLSYDINSGRVRPINAYASLVLLREQTDDERLGQLLNQLPRLTDSQRSANTLIALINELLSGV